MILPGNDAAQMRFLHFWALVLARARVPRTARRSPCRFLVASRARASERASVLTWEKHIVAERTVKSYKVLVGMEIHVQLATASKMFTGAANGFGGEPNSQVDEQVLGLPGVLPVMNKKAVEYAI